MWPRNLVRQGWRWSWPVLSVGLALGWGCSPDEEEALRRLVPDLPAETIQHLRAADDARLRALSHEIGIKGLIDLRLTLRKGLRFESPKAYARSAALLMPYLHRLSQQLATDYACDDYLRDDRFWMSLSPDRAAELCRMEAEMNDVYLDPALLLAEKAARFEVYRQRFREAGYWAGVVAAEYTIAEFMSALGREPERLRSLRRALRDARRADLTVMTCQILGVIGTAHRVAGQTDSMAVYWDRAQGIATRHRLPEHAAGILSRYANHYADLGDLALAGQLHAAAQEICREYKGGYLELRLLLEALFFHAELGQWQVVGQLLERARVLRREYVRSPRVVERKVHGLRLDEIEARYLMAKGAVKEADALFRRLEAETRRLPHLLDYPLLLYAWSRGLLSNDQPAEALPIIGRGLVHSIAASLPATRARFMALLARALQQLGNREAARQSWSDFAALAGELGPVGERALRVEWILHDAGLASLQLGEGHRTAAVAALQRGVGRLCGFLSQTRPSAQGYMLLGACDGLRQALHDLLRDDPAAGYRLEMGWRRLGRALGAGIREVDRAGAEAARPGRPAQGAALPPAELGRGDCARDLKNLLEEALRVAPARSWGTISSRDTFLSRLAERRAVHCLYLNRQHAVLRWTADARGIRCDSLGIAPEELHRQVTHTLELLSRDPGDPLALVTPELSRALRALALALLPPEILRPQVGREVLQLLATPDGCLRLLPFETLNLSPREGYAPLLEWCDVAYLRFAPSTATQARAVGKGVILADPQLPATLRRRYPSLRDLEQGIAEAHMVTSVLPGSWILSRQAATKERLLDLWEDVPFIYAAAHFIRDPEAPYMTFLPLSVPEGTQRPDASVLGIDEIRSADLGRCRLVVLSGCASGASYVAAGQSVPSLGDAFLDAGAAAVIQTFWRVRDEEAARLMRGFVREWAGSGRPPEEALSRARRAYMRTGQGMRHPFTWAAYAIKLGHF